MFDDNYQKIADTVTAFIRKTVGAAAKDRVVIGLSGGVDSAVSAALTTRAFSPAQIFPVLLPYGNTHPQGKHQARMVVQSCALPEENIKEIDIQPAVDVLAAHDKAIDKTRRGNIMARVRMTYLYDMAKKHDALVVGTENRSEHLLGYFTRHGDGAADLEPIVHLYKTQIYGLARHLGIPEEVVQADPTAGLWEDQTDEIELGFSYEVADKVLYLSQEKKMSQESIVKATNIDPEIVAKIFSRVAANRFKRIPVPSLV